MTEKQQIFEVSVYTSVTQDHPKHGQWNYILISLWLWAESSSEALRRTRTILAQLPFAWNERIALRSDFDPNRGQMTSSDKACLECVRTHGFAFQVTPAPDGTTGPEWLIGPGEEGDNDDPADHWKKNG